MATVSVFGEWMYFVFAWVHLYKWSVGMGQHNNTRIGII